MTTKPIMALLGFAFVAMWIATNLGYAVLCLVGATLFYLAGAVFTGELDLGDVQARLGSRTISSDPVYPSRTASPRRARVQ